MRAAYSALKTVEKRAATKVDNLVVRKVVKTVVLKADEWVDSRAV